MQPEPNFWAFQTDENGIYIGRVICQRSPAEPGKYLVPGGATDVIPPKCPPGKLLKFNFDTNEWTVVERDV